MCLHVMCVLQWQATERHKAPAINDGNFTFVKDSERATFAIIRVGGKAGTVLTLGEATAYSRETLQYIHGDIEPFYEAETAMQHMADISSAPVQGSSINAKSEKSSPAQNRCQAYEWKSAIKCTT